LIGMRRDGSDSEGIGWRTYGSVTRLDASGIRPMSVLDRLGGVCSRVGGVDASDRPEEPAVEGLPSTESFLTTGFFRAGTPSGHVHCAQIPSDQHPV